MHSGIDSHGKSRMSSLSFDPQAADAEIFDSAVRVRGGQRKVGSALSMVHRQQRRSGDGQSEESRVMATRASSRELLFDTGQVLWGRAHPYRESLGIIGFGQDPHLGRSVQAPGRPDCRKG